MYGHKEVRDGQRGVETGDDGTFEVFSGDDSGALDTWDEPMVYSATGSGDGPGSDASDWPEFATDPLTSLLGGLFSEFTDGPGWPTWDPNSPGDPSGFSWPDTIAGAGSGGDQGSQGEGDRTWTDKLWDYLKTGIDLLTVGIGAGTYVGPSPDLTPTSRESLTPEQVNNLNRYEKKLPQGASDTKIYDTPDGGKVFRAEVPGKVPGSRAFYEKEVDAAGKTIGYNKTTIDPQGNVVHTKDKFR